MLSAEQKAHWDAFGFVMLRRLFAPEEVEAIREATFEVVKGNGGLDALNGDEGWSIGGFMERHPSLISLLDDDRIHGIPQTLLGPDFVLEMTDGHVRAGNTPWHGRKVGEDSDGGYSDRFNCRVAFYFDRLTAENGALRVIPGSHRRPFADHLSPLWDQYDDPTCTPHGVAGPDVPSVVLESEPGDAAVFTESVYHGSFGGRARLQLTAQYVANPTSEEEIERIRRQHDKYKWGFHPAESAINSDRPRIRRMVAKLVELGFTPLKA